MQQDLTRCAGPMLQIFAVAALQDMLLYTNLTLALYTIHFLNFNSLGMKYKEDESRPSMNKSMKSLKIQVKKTCVKRRNSECKNVVKFLGLNCKLCIQCSSLTF